MAGNLDELLESWRATKATAVADAIDAVSVTAPEKLDHAAWLALAREDRSEDVATLCAHILDDGVSTLSGRIEQLCARPHDPRVSMQFAKMALDPPTTSTSNHSVWRQIFPYLKDVADPRILPILNERLAMPPGASQFWPKLYRGLEKAVKATKPAPALSAAEAKKTKELAKTKATSAKTKKTAAANAVVVEPTLAGALSAVESGDLAACLEALVAVWRDNRLTALGSMIDRVHAIAAGGLPPPSPKDWANVAATRTVVDIGRLAETAVDGRPSDAEKRLDEMFAWPPDPRIGKAMMVVAYTRFFADRSRAWKLTADLVIRNCDPRFAAEVEHFANPQGHNKALTSNYRRIAREVAAAVARMPAAPTPAETMALEKLDSAITKYLATAAMTEPKFLADIAAAAPDDTGPLLVYADWLTERGHPRGELIVLQCGEQTPEVAERTQRLCREHSRAVLGPATALGFSNHEYGIGAGMVGFVRGLSRYLQFRYRTPEWLVPQRELLVYLEEIDVGSLAAPDAVAVVRSLPRLRKLHGVQLELFAELCALPAPLPLEDVRLTHMREHDTPFGSWANQLSGIGLSNLKRLELYWSHTNNTIIDDIPPLLLASPAMSKVEELTVSTTELGRVRDALARHGRAVRRLSFARRHWFLYRIDLEDGQATVLPVSDGPVRVPAAQVDVLRTAVAGLPSGTPVTIDSRVSLEAPL